MWTIFKVFWIYYNIASVLCFGFLAVSHVDLSSPPGIEPAPPALEGEVLTTGPPGKSLKILITIILWFLYTLWQIPYKVFFILYPIQSLTIP